MSENEAASKLSEIEHKHFNGILWQVTTNNRRVIVEAFNFSKAKTIAVVLKYYDAPIPVYGSGKNWPNLVGAEVLVPAERSENDWEAIDRALTKISEEANPPFDGA